MSGTDIELLESYLDDALSASEAAALRGRLTNEPALSAELDQLRADRALRASAFASMEADDALAERLLANVGTRGEQRAKPMRWTTPLRYMAAAAACIALGFFAGQLLETRDPLRMVASPQAASAQTYQVAITDDAGGIIAVQKFDSLEQATEFSEDLRRWQERQERVRNGQITIRSARF